MTRKHNFASLDAHAQSLSDSPVDTAVEPCPLERRVRLRVLVRDSFFSVFTNKKYQLAVGSETFDGNTGEAGMIDHLIPKTARSARLRVWLTEGRQPRTWLLELGKLKPTSIVEGLQARLSNLGFEPGPIDGDMGPKTKRALATFQSAVGLSPSGEVDGETRSRLDSVYQSRDELAPLEGSWRPKPGEPFKRSKDRSADPPVSRVRYK